MKKTKIIILVLIIVSLFGCSEKNTIEPEVDKKYFISGQVNFKDDHGTEEAAKDLELILSGKTKYIDTTNSQVEFYFENVEAGEYVLSSNFAQLDTVIHLVSDTTISLKIQELKPAEWIILNSVKMNSIDPLDEDFSDLSELKKIIGNAKIVMLGEQSHRDGATFLTKTRLIKFLHKEMNFDVIAFESGLFDCWYAEKLLSEGNPSLEIIPKAVWGIWTKYNELVPLMEYIGETYSAGNKLELSGLDCTFSGELSANHAIDELKKYLSYLDIDTNYISNFTSTMQILYNLIHHFYITKNTEPSDNEQEKFYNTMSQIYNKIDSTNVGADELKEKMFWLQFLKSTIEYSKYVWLIDWDLDGQQSLFNIRDKQMGLNLTWLSNNYYPDRKIIVWAASYHIARNLSNTSIHFYSETLTMGDVVYENLGNQVYSLGFIAYTGYYGTDPYGGTKKLPIPPSNSYEAIIYKAGFENVIVDFRGNYLFKDWLTKERIARPLGYAKLSANWTEIFDGFVYNKTMFPCTRRIP